MTPAAGEVEEGIEALSPMLPAKLAEATSPPSSDDDHSLRRPWLGRAVLAVSLALALLGAVAATRRWTPGPRADDRRRGAPVELFSMPHLRLIPHLRAPWHQDASAPAPAPGPPAPASALPPPPTPAAPPPAPEAQAREPGPEARPPPATAAPTVPPAAPVAPAPAPVAPAAPARPQAEATAVEAAQGQCGAPLVGSIYEYEHGILVDGHRSGEACCAKCLAAPACVSWSLLTEGVLRPGVLECWIKSGKRKQILPKGGAVSGIVPSRSEPATFGTPAYALNYQARHTPISFPCEAKPLPQLWPPNLGGGARTELGVATWNLFWSSVFDQSRPGELHAYQATKGNTATQHLARVGQRSSSPTAPRIDLLAFQECMDVNWLFQQAGLTADFELFQGPEELCMAVRKNVWSVLSRGQSSVAEDKQSLYWRRRDVQWLRLRHQATGAAVLFLNHHGPLPIDSGGVCGGFATASNLLSLIAEQAVPGDVVLLVGDFNARAGSATIGQLKQRLRHVAAGTKQGGIDNVFTNLGASSLSLAATLGGAGSDHDALGAVLLLGGSAAAPSAGDGAAWPQPF